MPPKVQGHIFAQEKASNRLICMLDNTPFLSILYRIESAWVGFEV